MRGCGRGGEVGRGVWTGACVVVGVCVQKTFTSGVSVRWLSAGMNGWSLKKKKKTEGGKKKRKSKVGCKRSTDSDRFPDGVCAKEEG